MNKAEESILLSNLEELYGFFRRIQASHDSSPQTEETRCIGSGNCCKIGLVVPLLECFNIAKQIRSDYWFNAETMGIDQANREYEDILFRLKDAFNDPDWKVDDETATKRKCAFFREEMRGCGIYRYRPLICRAYGTITPVDTTCPRGRNENGDVIIFNSEEIDAAIDRFEALLGKYYEVEPANAFSVFMPLGVLRFLMPEEEFGEFFAGLDERFTKAHPGYPHQMKRKEIDVAISRKQ